MAGLSYLFGLKTDDFVILAADRMMFDHGAIVVSREHDKCFNLGDNVKLFCMGDEGDALKFGDFVQKNCALYKYRNGYELFPKEAAHWISKQISEALRTPAYMVDCLMGGYDAYSNKAYLASIDMYGSCIDSAPYLFRGFGARFSYALLDDIYSKTMDEREAINCLKTCLKGVETRFLAKLPVFQVVVIDRNGTRKLADINVETERNL